MITLKEYPLHNMWAIHELRMKELNQLSPAYEAGEINRFSNPQYDDPGGS